MKLNKLAFGFATGVFWSVSVMLIAIASMYFGYLTNVVDAIGTIYIGFDSTWLGLLIGGGWALVDGFFPGFLIALLYNLFSKNK